MLYGKDRRPFILYLHGPFRVFSVFRGSKIFSG